MSFSPPVAGTPQSFLDAVRACTFLPSSNALRDPSGVIKSPTLAASSTINTVEWGLDVPGSAPIALVDSRTYSILSQGTLQTSGTTAGTILWGGLFFRVRLVRHSDGSQWAEAGT
jgi:hypothetical protein